MPASLDPVVPMSLPSESDGGSVPTLQPWDPGVHLPGLESGEVRAWIVELDAGLAPGADVDSAEPGHELAILSDDERARAARFIRARERRRFARCRAALREILGGLLGEPAEALRFRAAAVGKPELDRGGPGVVEPIRFNISHSAELAIIAVSHGREVGVDVERLRPITEAERIVASFFTEAEQRSFTAIPAADRAAAFLRGWTRKEAVLKGFGTGISGLAAKHETGFGTAALAPRFAPAGPAPRVDRWILWEAAPRPEFVAALAVDVETGIAPTEPGSLPAGPAKP